jgi:predicted regulator of Ras-like GTPase activity (Roadblock/LC7/MglB family)
MSPHTQPSQFGWLVNDFAERVPGVAHAVVVSADGLLLTSSARLPDRVGQILTPELRAQLQGAGGRMVGQPA